MNRKVRMEWGGIGVVAAIGAVVMTAIGWPISTIFPRPLAAGVAGAAIFVAMGIATWVVSTIVPADNGGRRWLVHVADEFGLQGIAFGGVGVLCSAILDLAWRETAPIGWTTVWPILPGWVHFAATGAATGVLGTLVMNGLERLASRLMPE